MSVLYTSPADVQRARAAEAELAELRVGIAEARAGILRHATVTPGQRAILAAVFDAAIAGETSSPKLCTGGVIDAAHVCPVHRSGDQDG